MSSDYDMEDKASILLVDDMPENLRLLSDILSRYGYLVRPLRESPMAFSSVIHTAPDLILLDVMMPDMDGYEVCRRLKADSRTRDIPVIFISALTEMSDKVKGFAVGGVDYITKPFQHEDVIIRVKTQIALRKTQQRLQHQNVQLHQEISERKRAEEELQRRNRELALLNQMSQLFSSSLELDQVLLTALQEVQRLLNVVSTSIWLLLPETQEIECRQIIGPGSEALLHSRLPAGQGITGWAAQHGESVIVPDILADARHYSQTGPQNDSPVRSMLSVPLKNKGNIIGVLNLIDPQVARFTREDLRVVEPIAGAAAVAIENARLYTMAQQELVERKRAEAALLAAHNDVKEKNAQLEELNASKDKFFSIISHDLRSPFNALLGFAQLLLEQFDRYSKADILSYIEKLYHSAERLYALLENLLTWSRIQRGAMEFRPEPLNMRAITEYTLDLFASKVEQKQIALSHTIPADLTVCADEQMLTTIMRNLISNAIKFTSQGGAVTISAQPRNDDHALEVTVADTGLGILPEHLSKLFRIDVQFTNVGTAGERGTGLGLNLCKDLVEKHQGRIWVESEPGQGTAFRFTLPLSTR